MKTQTLLLIAGAVGVGYLLHKKKLAEAKATAIIPGTPVARIARALPEEDADVIFVEPDVEYVPYPAWGWNGPSWGGWGRGGVHHHHHHGHHGFHGYSGHRGRR